MNKKILSAPYLLWSVVFIIIPLLMVFYYGLTDKSGAFTLENILAIATVEHSKALWLAIKLSIESTIICLILAYPLSMILSKLNVNQHSFIVFIFILPMWMNFLLRTLAWQTLLEKTGVINSILKTLGLPGINIINTSGAIILGMVYNFLPFMIIQIYTSLTKMDYSLIEAAKDLGASPRKCFTKVTLPLSMPGVISGITLVFLPSVSSFCIPRMLGGGSYVMVGTIIESQFLTAGDWNFGSAISLIMAVIIMISMYITKKVDKGEKMEANNA